MCSIVDLYSVPSTLYERAVFLDSSAFIELELQNPEAVDCKNQIDLNSIPTFTTPLIIAEAHKRLLYDHGIDSAFSFLSGILNSTTNIIRHDRQEDIIAKELIQQYWDLGLTFCDAVSFAVMLKIGVLCSFTYDRSHFQALGFITCPPFYL